MPRHSEATLAAIKSAVDIVSLVRDYLPLHQTGSKFKALCPFHDDHNPSLELNPERQSFRCWSCGAGGDVFDFVKDYERVEFPEALRMLAERAGVALDDHESRSAAASGPSRADLLAVLAWAEGVFVEALGQPGEAREYLARRKISPESALRFRLGYAPEGRDWLQAKARRQGVSTELLEKSGLVGRSTEPPHAIRERFRGRLMFPIRDPRGRTLGFGGRILPTTEKTLSELGRNVAKYLNSPETALFQKRRTLYAADLARAAARQAGWVAVVEGYTDVIAAHQVGLENVVGTLGTALGDDHVLALRRLADQVVLVFDGDEAGQSAADRSLELFLGHEVDVRVLTLPDGLDPCDFLLERGAEPFRAMIENAVDPLDFAIQRASTRFDLGSVEGSRQAAEWVLSIFAQVPRQNRAGLDLKLAKALDTLSRRLGVSVADLKRRLSQIRRGVTRPSSVAASKPTDVAPASPPVRASELPPLDRELVTIALNDPMAVASLMPRVPVASINHPTLRAILQACYELAREGQSPTFDFVTSRLDDPSARALAAELVSPLDPAPLSASTEAQSAPASWGTRLTLALRSLDEREWQARYDDLQAALNETDSRSEPDQYQVLFLELFRHKQRRFAARRGPGP